MSFKYRVGLRTLSLTDSARLNWQATAPRPFVTDIWYPADASASIGHYVFLDECTDFGKEQLPMLCVDLPRIDRRAIHMQVSEMARLFFEATL